MSVDTGQRRTTINAGAAAALEAQRELRSNSPTEATADAKEAQMELRDNQVRPARS